MAETKNDDSTGCVVLLTWAALIVYVLFWAVPRGREMNVRLKALEDKVNAATAKEDK